MKIGAALALAATLGLAGCFGEKPKPEVALVTVVPDLPRPDQKLLQKKPRRKCVKSAVNAGDMVPLDVVVNERDCYKTRAFDAEATLDKLQDSVTDAYARIDDLRAQNNKRMKRYNSGN